MYGYGNNTADGYLYISINNSPTMMYAPYNGYIGHYRDTYFYSNASTRTDTRLSDAVHRLRRMTGRDLSDQKFDEDLKRLVDQLRREHEQRVELQRTLRLRPLPRRRALPRPVVHRRTCGASSSPPVRVARGR